MKLSKPQPKKVSIYSRLKEGYMTNRVRDRTLAAEWALLGDK
ncbi:MAG: hypothetical protein AAB737_03340 [Patescibacteria group bacterium]